MTGAASAARHVVHTLPPGAHGVTAPVKSTTLRNGHELGGEDGVTWPMVTCGGAATGGGGDGGLGQLLSALSEATDTPALNMTPACADMHAPSVAVSVEDTPATTKGVASAVTQVVQAFVTLEHGVTAALKF